MKSELQDKLVEILSGIQGAVNKGSDFVLTQLPDVAQSYIAFGRVWCVVEILMSAAVIGVGVWALKWGSKKEHGDWDLAPDFARLGGVIAGCFGFVLLVFSVKDALLVWFAPKVWLLTEIAGLVKGH